MRTVWLTVAALALVAGACGGGGDKSTTRSMQSGGRPPATVLLTTTTRPPLVDGVAFVGDSLAENLGAGLVEPGRAAGVQIFNDGISGCGVTRSGAFRLSGARLQLSPVCEAWPETWAERLRRDRPKVVAIQVGRHEVLDRQLEGEWTDISKPAYRAYLRTELARAIGIAGAEGAHVVLLTSPMFRRAGPPWPENEPSRVTTFNALLVDVAATHPRVSVIDLGAKVSVKGAYADVVDGVTVRSDGVHFSRPGVVWIGQWLLPQLVAVVRG